MSWSIAIVHYLGGCIVDMHGLKEILGVPPPPCYYTHDVVIETYESLLIDAGTYFPRTIPLLHPCHCHTQRLHHKSGLVPGKPMSNCLPHRTGR